MTLNRPGRLSRSFPLGVFLAALLFRLIPVLLTRSLSIGLDDMFQYDMLARSLAAGNGFRWYASADLEMLKPYVDFDLSSMDYDPMRGVETSFRAPLYPAFLSLIYLLVGSGANRFFAARLAQTFLGAALAPLTYLVAKKTSLGNERAAKISAWVVAAYPILLAYPLGLGTENPFFLLLLASFLFLLKASEQSAHHALRNMQYATRDTVNSSFIFQPSSLFFLLSGFFLGLTALTRSVILPFAALAIPVGCPQLAVTSQTDRYRNFDGLQPVSGILPAGKWFLCFWSLAGSADHSRRC
jgi:hypothetical protein